ncbi:MAG: GTP 3',8-cyclase MoaA [Alphaproteobacteria bacterium]|nr:GTP 3',8-cyclase MoaA [Alphaproteobacteria bacterium]
MRNLVDPFGRTIQYLRLSVTDRCDFRCVYCMPEKMQFLPKKDILDLEELEKICATFIKLGVKKIRLTGGEPLVRRNIMNLIFYLSSFLKNGQLEEITLTTNGSQLSFFAKDLFRAGIQRINVSLDSLNHDKFLSITRKGNLSNVLEGIKLAQKEGLQIKINMVALKGINDNEFTNMVSWCIDHKCDLTFIEIMPMGEIDQHRIDQYMPLSEVKQIIEKNWILEPIPYRTGGPARYMKINGQDIKLGFITPLTHNFCENCNRVRVTCTGQLYLCLGQDNSINLKNIIRNSSDINVLEQEIIKAIKQKPKGHDFIIGDQNTKPSIARHMSMTGG